MEKKTDWLTDRRTSSWKHRYAGKLHAYCQVIRHSQADLGQTVKQMGSCTDNHTDRLTSAPSSKQTSSTRRWETGYPTTEFQRRNPRRKIPNGQSCSRKGEQHKTLRGDSPTGERMRREIPARKSSRGDNPWRMERRSS